MFDKYFSNVSCGTGNNYILLLGEAKTLKTRVFFKPEVAGKYNYRFFYQNSVNSTCAQGEHAYVNQSGGNWTINYAKVGIGSEYGCYDALECFIPVTFGGEMTKNGLHPGHIVYICILQILFNPYSLQAYH